MSKKTVAINAVRIARRFKCEKRAIAEYGGDKYPCIIRDLSGTGAAIEFQIQ